MHKRLAVQEQKNRDYLIRIENCENDAVGFMKIIEFKSEMTDF